MKPRIIAHRGLHDSAAENTVAALQAAWDAGVDGAEIDVRLTRDGVPVLTHDALVRGQHLPYPVAWSRRATLPLDALDDALQVLAADRSPARLVLDVKVGAQLHAVASWCRTRRAGGRRIALWCRSAAAIRALTTESPFAELALLSNDTDVERYIAAAVGCGATAISLHPDALSPEAVRKGQRAGLTVYAWITDPARHVDAILAGADGLVTDWVDRARQDIAGAA